MLIYRLVLERVIKYFHLDELFKEDEIRLILLKKKKKVIYKPTLQFDQRLVLSISAILTAITVLMILTIPLAVLESPCEGLLQHKYDKLHIFSVFFYEYWGVVDRLVFILSVILVIAFIKLVRDAIKRTKINTSPWVEQGKYELPPKNMKYIPMFKNETIQFKDRSLRWPKKALSNESDVQRAIFESGLMGRHSRHRKDSSSEEDSN